MTYLRDTSDEDTQSSYWAARLYISISLWLGIGAGALLIVFATLAAANDRYLDDQEKILYIAVVAAGAVICFVSVATAQFLRAFIDIADNVQALKDLAYFESKRRQSPD